ncbi:DUF6920 family protein [Salinigranum sp. GCM10025319]|uniref:DUF6920 family protein n=1 Tax=Salinigranum sp. GCM10025319 TaxID=3252687 RepID=UPI00361AE885
MDRSGRAFDWWWMALAGLVVTGGLLVLGRRREGRAVERTVGRLLGDDRPTRGRTHDDTTESTGPVDGHDLPAPVQRYFDTVLPERDPGTAAVRIEQSGDLRLGGVDSAWKPFRATHHAVVGRPGFVWDATVDLLPFVSARIRDTFVDGEGSARVTLFGAFPVAGADPSPELNEAELQRYLAEAVWYPTALLPENGVRWEGIDDRTARATLERGDTAASLVFHFSAGNEVERVHATHRYRRVDGGFEPTPWTGLWREYEVRDGVRVPTAGEVVWHLPDGDLRAWRGYVDEVERRRSA